MNKTIYATLLTSAFLSINSVIAQEQHSHQQLRPQVTEKGKNTRIMQATVTTTDNYVPGSTMDIYFQLNFVETDGEFGDMFTMTFPADITVNSASDSLGVIYSNGDSYAGEALNTPIVSPVVSWGDDDNVYGDLYDGHSHEFYVNITIPANYTGNIDVNWEMSDDQYGANPAPAIGVVSISPMATDPDLVVVGFANTLYYQLPVSQAANIEAVALVGNFGADLTTSHQLNTEYVGTAYTNTQALSNPLLEQEVDTLIIPGGGFSNVGLQEIYFDATLTNDLDNSDNVYSYFVDVTDSTLSYADTLTNGTNLGFGFGVEAVIGNVYTLSESDALTSVAMYSPNSNTNAVVSFVIYEVDQNTGIPTGLLWESDTFNTDIPGSAIYTKQINTPISISSGNAIFIGVKESSNTDNMAIGANLDAYIPGIGFGLYEGTWYETSDLGVQGLVSIMANFGETAPNSVSQIEHGNFMVFPNPTTGIITLDGIDKGTLNVLSMDGKILKTMSINNLNSTVNLSDLKEGIYLLQLIDENETKVSKISIQK